MTQAREGAQLPRGSAFGALREFRSQCMQWVLDVPEHAGHVPSCHVPISGFWTCQCMPPDFLKASLPDLTAVSNCNIALSVSLLA